MAINWDQTLGDMAKEFGSQIFVAAKGSAGDAWEQVEDVNKEQLENLASLMGKLRVRELAGEDVSNLVLHVEAQMANLSFVNASIGARSVQAFWEKAAEISVSIIVGVAGKFIGL
tara:strand:+ start:22427 stop:22771 length:345 start_codon:yes stop_codon:yes gene_type:complete